MRHIGDDQLELKGIVFFTLIFRETKLQAKLDKNKRCTPQNPRSSSEFGWLVGGKDLQITSHFFCPLPATPVGSCVAYIKLYCQGKSILTASVLPQHLK